MIEERGFGIDKGKSAKEMEIFLKKKCTLSTFVPTVSSFQMAKSLRFGTWRVRVV